MKENIGNAFDLGTGTFTAPVAGTYMFSLRVYYDTGTANPPARTCAVINRFGAGQAERRVAEIWVLKGSSGSETTMQVLAAGEKVIVRFAGILQRSDNRPDDPEQIQRIEFNGFLLGTSTTTATTTITRRNTSTGLTLLSILNNIWRRYLLVFS
jgi:hypothetical protein